MMARRSKTENDTPRALANGSQAPETGSKIAVVAKWLRRIFSTVLVLAVLAAVGVVSVALVQGTWQVNPVDSGSMRPGFAVGGVVISERLPLDQLVLRDVMVFASPDDPAKLIVHRIVEMSKSKSGQLEIRTQGDANNVRDPWTLTIKGHYAYVVRWSLPLLGYVAIAYQNNRGLVLLAAGLLLIAAAASAILKQRRRDEKPDASDESESSESLDSAATWGTGPADDDAAPPSAEVIDAQSESAQWGHREPGPPGPASKTETPDSDAEATTVTSDMATSEAAMSPPLSSGESVPPLPSTSEAETPVSDADVTPATMEFATSEGKSIESESQSAGESELPSDSSSPKKISWRQRFGAKES